jgi:hypothetical protein
MTAADSRWFCTSCDTTGITDTSAAHHVTATDHCVVSSTSTAVGVRVAGQAGGS